MECVAVDQTAEDMSRKDSSAVLSVGHHHCCGLDIHKDKISATSIRTCEDGSIEEEFAEFGTFTDDFCRLKKWLLEQGCQVVAMESTGVYWRPVHNVLEDIFQVILVNARHVKHLPGRKTDVIDSRWLAGLLRHGLLKGKEEELLKSIKGFLSEHHRFQLVSMLTLIETVEKQISLVHDRLCQLLSDRRDKIERLMEVPAISEVSAHALLSDIGETLDQLESAAFLASWAGLCPGNNESAGKRHSGRSPVRNGRVKTIMVEVAWGAVKKKGSYYRESYYSLRARKGSRKAIFAVAHRILKAVFFILKFDKSYRERGDVYLVQLNTKARLHNLQKLAAKLGYTLVAAQA